MEELQRVLRPHSVLSPRTIGVSFHADETGDTYLENALIKARALAAEVRGRVIAADDSGLSVPALGGAPGVRSARFGSREAGRLLESEERNALLLSSMKGIVGEDRRAFFVCCMVLMLDEHRVFTVQETFEGFIADEPAGSAGFGYDPIFYLPEYGMSAAQLKPEEKDAISHRGRAGMRLKGIIESLERLE